MAKQSAVNLDISPNNDGYAIGGGTTKRTLTVSGSDISIIGGPSPSTLTISGSDISLIGGTGAVEILFPTSSASMAAANLTNTFSVYQIFSSSIILPINTISGIYTASTNDMYLLANTNPSTASILLYQASPNLGRQLTIKNIGTGQLYINASGSDLIDSQSQWTLTSQYTAMTIIASSSYWHIV